MPAAGRLHGGEWQIGDASLWTASLVEEGDGRCCRGRGHDRLRAEGRIVGSATARVVLVLGQWLDWSGGWVGCSVVLGMGWWLGLRCGEVWDTRIATMLAA